MKKRIKNIFNFLGKKVIYLFVFSFFLGVSWFLVELSFIYVLQSFLAALDLFDWSKTTLPFWYPRDINKILILMLLMGVVRGGIVFFKIFISSTINQVFVLKQRNFIFEKIFFSRQESESHYIIDLFGECVNRAGLFLNKASELSVLVVSLSFLILFSFKIAPIELIISLSLMSIFVAPLKLMSKKITIAGQGVKNEWNFLNKQIIVSLKNNFIIKLYNKSLDEYIKTFLGLDQYSKHVMNYNFTLGIRLAYPTFVGIFVICSVTFLSKKYLETSPVHLFSFFYIFIRIAQGVSDLSAGLIELRFHYPSLRELINFNLKENDILNSASIEESCEKEFIINKIELGKVDFSYNGKNNIVSDFNLLISKGDFVVVKGRSGTGKSTLVKIILGVLQNCSGFIKVNDQLLSSLSLKKYHSAISYVGPEPYLFPSTIRENLLYGNTDSENIEDQHVWSALGKVGLIDMVKALPLGLDEVLSENTEFSTGEKQRISFARAILRKSSLMILDEATANIDKETERSILNALGDIKNDIMILNITHKDVFDKYANQIINLNNE